MELGADAVLVNTAIGTAADPVAMAAAFRLAVVAGRAGYRAGLPAASTAASASSPLTGFLDSPACEDPAAVPPTPSAGSTPAAQGDWTFVAEGSR